MENEIISVGKYKNKTFIDVYRTDYLYCKWILNLEQPTGILNKFKQFILEQNSNRYIVEDLPSTSTNDYLITKYKQKNSYDLMQAKLPTASNSSHINSNSNITTMPKNNDLLTNSNHSNQIIYKLNYDKRNSNKKQKLDMANNCYIIFEYIRENRMRLNLAESNGKTSVYLGSDLFYAVKPYLDNKISDVQGCVIDVNNEKDIQAILDKFGIKYEATPDFVYKLLNYRPQSEQLLPDLINQATGCYKLYNALRDFQKQAVKFAVSRNGRCLIADEMGLGKTLEALSIMANYRKDWPLIIICPGTLRFQWNDQIRKWLSPLFNNISRELCVITSGKTQIPLFAKCVICSYELAYKIDVTNIIFNSAIVDESHYLKDQATKRVRCLTPFLQSMKRVILLSGTPALNKPTELFIQLSILDQNICTFETFADRYSYKTFDKWTKKVKYAGSKLGLELNCILNKSYMIRRLKINVYQELPSKIRTHVPIELSNAQKQIISQKMSELNKLKSDVLATKRAIIDLFEMTGKLKLQFVIDYIRYMATVSKKIIIFAHHRNVLDEIEKSVKAHKYNCIRIDGSTTQKKREEYLNKYKENENIVFALLSITSCGHGLDITVADTIIFAELYWVPGQIMQAEDRIHRLSSKFSQINIQYIIAKDTIDETIWRTLNKKWKIITESLNGTIELMDCSHFDQTEIDFTKYFVND